MPTLAPYTVLAAGGTDTPNYLSMPNIITIDANGVTLVGNYSIDTASSPSVGTTWTVYLDATGLDLNGNSFSVFGQPVTADMETASTIWFYVFEVIQGGALAYTLTVFDLPNAVNALNATMLLDASITLAKFPALTRGYILRGDATGRPEAYDANGNAQILIGDGTDINSVAVTGDIAITSAGLTSIAAGVIVNADISATAAIAYSKLAALTSANILVGSAANVATSVTMSGDATISNTGALTIANDAVENAMIADDAVTLTNLASTGQLESLTTTSPTPNSTALTVLASLAIPTGAMDADGEVLEVFAYGTTGATANNKTITLVLGTTVLATNTTTAAPNALNWTLEARVFRTGAASQKGYCKFSFNGVASEIDVFTGAETWLGNTIYVKGQNGTAAVGEIVLESAEFINNKKNNN